MIKSQINIDVLFELIDSSKDLDDLREKLLVEGYDI